MSLTQLTFCQAAHCVLINAQNIDTSNLTAKSLFVNQVLAHTDAPASLARVNLYTYTHTREQVFGCIPEGAFVGVSMSLMTHLQCQGPPKVNPLFMRLYKSAAAFVVYMYSHVRRHMKFQHFDIISWDPIFPL